MREQRNRKGSPGKEVEVVSACYEKREEPLSRNKADVNGDTRENEERKAPGKVVGQGRDGKEKGLSVQEMYDRATWRRMSSYIDPTGKWEYEEEEEE